MDPMWVLGIAVGVIGALMGFCVQLLMRQIDGLDKKLDAMKEDAENYKANTREVLTRIFERVDEVAEGSVKEFTDVRKELTDIKVHVERLDARRDK
jgi:uncharacterized membrane-anchored protein YhcB (DUF1043 family)